MSNIVELEFQFEKLCREGMCPYNIVVNSDACMHRWHIRSKFALLEVEDLVAFGIRGSVQPILLDYLTEI